jgi:hypothetical protein
MIFTNSRAQVSYTSNFLQSSKNTNKMSTLPISLIRPKHVPEQKTNIVSITKNIDISVKKMKWGEPIWNLFHVLAEKVKEETFANIREELLNIIYTICANLPCPDCANHATTYMNNINYSYKDR